MSRPLLVSEELDIRFSYHPPKEGQPELFEEIRAKARELGELVMTKTPSSREQSLALTALEESVFWANAAIARRSEP